MATMMNNHTKRSNPRRQNGGRPDKRSLYSPDRGGNKQRGSVDRERPVLTDGVYKNQRFTHLFMSLVGCVVQVQVKNGNIYEGVLKTSSPKMDIVLELAHMVEPSYRMDGDGQNSFSTPPSRDRLIDKLVLKLVDIVSVNALDTNLDYAVKDAFTDTAISKYNGDMKEKDLKELQPWDAGEGAEVVGGLEGDRSNGWDADEMFRTNRVQFNVQTSYDDSLSQYTTKLEKKNTDEYKKREELALRMAAEIEGTDQYKKNVAMENGDGDEEDKFSSVVRPDSNPGGSQRYVPPNRRPGGNKPMRGVYGNQGHMNRSSPPQPHPHNHPHPYKTESPAHQQPAVSQSQPQSITGPNTVSADVAKLNGEGSSISASSNIKPSQELSPVPVSEKPEPSQNPSSPSSSKSGEKWKNSTKWGQVEKGREECLQELKDFSDKFKLEVEPEKEKPTEKDQSSKEVKPERTSPMERQDSGNSSKNSSKVEEQHKQEESPSQTQTQSQPHSEGKETGTAVSQGTESAGSQSQSKSSFKLNPLANPFQPRQTQQPPQIPTPPRGHTPHTSPIVQSMPIIGPQPVFTGQGQYLIQSMVPQNPTQTQSRATTKRAVVSVGRGYSEVAAQAQAATGQPLLAQSTGPHHGAPGYIYQMVPPQPTNFQMGQMIPVQSNQGGPRYMAPSTMGQSMPGQAEQTSQVHSGQFGVHNPQQTGPMPAHMQVPTQPALNHPNITHHPMPTPQATQMSGPPQSAGPHPPAPSPVHNTGPNPQHPQHPAHPPSSGTPQPTQVYSQVGMQGSHPPLQPSPHNPTSPQGIQMPYQFSTSHGGHPMQIQGGPQFSLTQQSSVPTSATYSMPTHGHHSPHMTPQFVMMPNTGQLQHPHIHSTQYQGHPISGPGGQVHGQAQMLQQGGVQAMQAGNPNQGGPHQHPMQPFPQGLTATALTNALHARQDHFIVHNMRK